MLREIYQKVDGFISQKETLQLELLHSFICFNQGKYIEFEYLLGEKHKELRIELRKDDQPERRIEQIKEKFETLTNYIEKEIRDFSSTNFGHILQFFDLTYRSKFSPRVCIKSVRNGRIIDIVRADKSDFTEEYTIAANTGFSYVVENGLYYLENNIPQAAKDGKYVNPRLDPIQVANYKPTAFDILDADRIDEKWCRYWRSSSNQDELELQRTCYKSTLIVPMTLLNKTLDPEFMKKFKINDNQGRTIFGYLCLDHSAINYFKDEDVQMCYIFADILSLYFVTIFVHTNHSITFNDANNLIGGVSNGTSDGFNSQ